MGMGSPDNRRKADGSYQTQGVGRGFFVPSSARERADNGWASCLLDNRNLARGYDVDRWRGGLCFGFSLNPFGWRFSSAQVSPWWSGIFFKMKTTRE